jgi:hypothetical protein
MSAYQVVHMVAVRHLLMPAGWAVLVSSLVRPTVVLRRAGSRVAAADGDLMIVDVIGVQVVQVAIMEIVGVTLVPYGCVSAIRTVRVSMSFVLSASACHDAS